MTEVLPTVETNRVGNIRYAFAGVFQQKYRLLQTQSVQVKSGMLV
jgi:hypothetical protein